MDFEDRYRKWSSCDPAELFSEARVVTYVPEDKQDIKKNLEQAARSADTYVLTGYAYQRTSHLRAVRTRGAGQLARGPHVLYVRRTRTSLGRAKRTAYRVVPHRRRAAAPI